MARRLGAWRICLPALVLFTVQGAVAVAQPAWEQLRGYYAYDAALPLNAVEQEPVDRLVLTVQEVRFESPAVSREAGEDEGGPRGVEVVPAVVCLPKGVERAPVILFLHGLGGSRANATTMLAPFLCPMGVAVVSIDAQAHGDRKQEGQPLFSADIPGMVAGFRQSIIDNRRALDYIASRPDLDADRVVLVGVSMGGIMGSVVTAVDDRVTGAFLIVGGGDWQTLMSRSEIGAARQVRGELDDLTPFLDALAYVEPVNFAAHIAPRPLHMVNGRDDKIIPAASAEALYAAARDPKRMVWYDGGAMDGHVPPFQVLFSELQLFLRMQGVLAGG